MFKTMAYTAIAFIGLLIVLGYTINIILGTNEISVQFFGLLCTTIYFSTASIKQIDQLLAKH